MISAHTNARIEVAVKLRSAKEILLAVRIPGCICLNRSDIQKIENITLRIDTIVNSVMGVGKKEKYDNKEAIVSEKTDD